VYAETTATSAARRMNSTSWTPSALVLRHAGSACSTRDWASTVAVLPTSRPTSRPATTASQARYTSLVILIGIPSPTHSFMPGVKPSFAAKPAHRSLFFASSGFSTWIPPDCLLLLLSIFRLLHFSFSCFYTFSCRFRAVD